MIEGHACFQLSLWITVVRRPKDALIFTEKTKSCSFVVVIGDGGELRQIVTCEMIDGHTCQIVIDYGYYGKLYSSEITRNCEGVFACLLPIFIEVMSHSRHRKL